MSKRAKSTCLFVHYNASMRVSDYVITYLEHLSAIGFEIFLISNSPIKQECQDLIANQIPNCKIFERENEGIDFGDWIWSIQRNLFHEDTDYLLLYISIVYVY